MGPKLGLGVSRAFEQNWLSTCEIRVIWGGFHVECPEGVILATFRTEWIRNLESVRVNSLEQVDWADFCVTRFRGARRGTKSA